jgi:hypothetical protein
MFDWMSDPQREAYKRAMEDYDKFADIVHHWDQEARPAHDDIKYDSKSLDYWDGADFSFVEQNAAYISVVLYNVDEALRIYGSWEEIPEDYDFDQPATEPFDYDDGNPTGWICDKCKQEDDDAGT